MASGSEHNKGEVAAENDRLRAENSRLTDEVDRLAGENLELRAEIDSIARKIAAPKKRLGKNSENSSLPPFPDLFGRKKDRPENANRAAPRALGRKPGNQPSTDGKHLAHVVHPTSCSSTRFRLAMAAGQTWPTFPLSGRRFAGWPTSPYPCRPRPSSGPSRSGVSVER
jgi:hypothetical protein